tara:strand:- start:229 stop:399 length:171 start_codon:yes stop_codon:yes gene_type:complete
MSTYSMHIKSAPPEAQKGAISIIQANSLNEAISLFAQRKVLSIIEFKKLFTVKLIK